MGGEVFYVSRTLSACIRSGFQAFSFQEGARLTACQGMKTHGAVRWRKLDDGKYILVESNESEGVRV